MTDTINPDDYTGAELKKLAQEKGVSTAGAKPAIAARISAAMAEAESLPAPPPDAPVETSVPNPDPESQTPDPDPEPEPEPEPEVEEDDEDEELPFDIQLGSDSTGLVSVLSEHFQITEGPDRYRGLTLVSVGRRGAVGVAPLVFVREEFEEFVAVVQHVEQARELS